jgi:uncharacterized membrane protein
MAPRGNLLVRLAAGRPRLFGSALTGAVAALLASGLSPALSAATAAILGWNVFCLVFLAAIVPVIRTHGPDGIRANAARDDEGRHLILALVLAATVVSLAVAAGELHTAKSAEGLVQAAHVGVALVSVISGWLLVHVIFALHYAHLFYARDKTSDTDLGGLLFPGGGAPDYQDFVHFALVIGVAAQTADIAFTDKRQRRLGTLHSLVAFVFNTMVVALAINLAAGLF